MQTTPSKPARTGKEGFACAFALAALALGQWHAPPATRSVLSTARKAGVWCCSQTWVGRGPAWEALSSRS